jgi:hypothetical protein
MFGTDFHAEAIGEYAMAGESWNKMALQLFVRYGCNTSQTDQQSGRTIGARLVHRNPFSSYKIHRNPSSLRLNQFSQY